MFENPDLQDQHTQNKNFGDLGLDTFYVSVLKSLNLIQPTVVQYHSIITALTQPDTNLIVQSKSGTGKTVAFISIFLNSLILADNKNNLKADTDSGGTKRTRVLIIEPTRELAIQVHSVMRKILDQSMAVKPQNQSQKHTKRTLNKLAVNISIGGLPIEDDKKNYLQIGFDIVIGTVGRLFQLVNKKIVKLDQVEYVVLDEGDKLFDQQDNIKRVREILSKVSKDKCRELIFSATYTQKCLALLKASQREYVFLSTIANKGEMQITKTTDLAQVDSQSENKLLELSNISRFQLPVKAGATSSRFNSKLSQLKWMLKDLTYQKCLVFVEKKAQIAQVHEYIKELKPLLIHGSLSQAARIKLLNQLSHDNKIIVTSDLLARGIDILVDLIVLFDASEGGENFWHRIGRTGRIGRKGVVVSLDSVENWPFFEKVVVQKALEQARFIPDKRRDLFGEYMSDLGRWVDVNHEVEATNHSNYRYFDEEEFQANMKKQIQLLEALEADAEDSKMELEVELPEQSEQIEQECSEHRGDQIPSFSSQEEMRAYICKLLECPQCQVLIRSISELTGYKFQFFQYL